MATSAARLRVLFCVQSLEGGGAERQLTYLANALSLREWDVHLAVLRFGPNSNRIERDRVALHHLDVGGNYDPRLIGAVWRVIRKIKPDIVLTWLPQMDIVGGLCATLAGVPWVLCERTSGRAYAWSLRDVVRRSIGSRAAAVVANSVSGAAYWNRLASRGRSIHVVPNIVPIGEIEAAVGAVRAWECPGPFTQTVVATGRLVSLRNYDVLIAAWADVRRSTPAHLLILGDGPEASRLRRLVDHLDLGGAVQFAGYVDDVFQRMSSAAAYVSLSSVEGHPNATIEAAAVGCPMVLSDIPEHRSLFTTEEALFVGPNDSTRLASAILDVLKDRPASARRAEAARQRITEAAATDIAGVYDQLLRRVANTDRH